MQVLSAKGYDVYGMTNRSTSQSTSAMDQSQTSSAGQSTVQDRVTLSPQARELAESQATSQVKTAATATFNTNKGDIEMDIEAYFSPKQSSFSGGIDSLPPFLFPTENNINALAKHISSTMPGLMNDLWHSRCAGDDPIRYKRPACVTKRLSLRGRIYPDA